MPRPGPNCGGMPGSTRSACSNSIQQTGGWPSTGTRAPCRRPTDNLYTDWTLALDSDTGKVKSYHQYTPHDSWDWDEVSAPLLIDTEVDGKLTKTATHAGRNGYLWILVFWH